MYYPNLKTTDSELRAIRHLGSDVKSRITPVFELTRSRKTKSLPEGSLETRAKQLNEVYGANSFILDLSTEQDLMNEETVNLFDEAAGYAHWKTFLEANFSKSIVPCALYVEEGSKDNFKEQVRWIVAAYGRVCLRTSVADEFAATLYAWALEVANEKKIILCPILYYLDPTELTKTAQACQFYITTVVGNRYPDALIFAGSSFPRYVTDLIGCGDDRGAFDLNEIRLEDWLKQNYPNVPLEKSDFASVHPRRYPTKGGNWIPRIDYIDGDQFRYSRIRRDQGGYAAAAMRIDTTSIMKLPRCWGTNQIVSAKNGVVLGGSPSFWISVRINCWITRRAGIL
ncbi:beta family protein [Rhizobium leguminosarum]|uniref:Beta family protein n=1 Tax=Rhizobium leguminosarum bv. viciae TaxID=387 RepID=A0A8G2J3H0_RHILV|nr:hypothetical protein [Rhizobium leguminosarum]MBY5619958.1 hypothetical protein [Rhizobium leguminosarum]NKK18610.1 hypothetical protein [Rhizobium leguminosarum bv. viciae]TBX98102.1 hypothetical protein E0H31_04130 [Rhizobium leguminosarum bv. viciae]TBZ09431.1 hypothetical protein E0H33_25410 [Rhizobium leguminosarum bv. viciae]TBZ10938.1 hypothetical protein E0H52_32575 [Rhizobium leguminosarum bv. viciae]